MASIPESENGDFIPGIYNYCDRWCERCSLSANCRQYAMECARDAFNADGSNDGDSAEFMESLMCLPTPEEGDASGSSTDSGIDHDEAESDSSFTTEYEEFDADEYIAERERIDRQTKSTPCVKLADQYMGDARRWLDEWEVLLEEIEIKNDSAGVILPEAREVIDWYLFQIPTKLRRAIHGKLRGDSYMIDDVNGSAKVVLIGIDKSLVAWKSLRSQLPEGQQNAVDPVIQLLARLCEEIEYEIPDARGFKRPGFDD